jgi:bifunctional DNase/RNase
MFMRDISKERPLTHDLMGHLMTALGAHVERIIINDLKNATYYARMIICAENEVQQKKIIELDARPSDCIAVATQQKAPIYVSQEVWDEVDDMTDVLRKMEEEGLKPDPEAETESGRKSKRSLTPAIAVRFCASRIAREFRCVSARGLSRLLASAKAKLCTAGLTLGPGSNSHSIRPFRARARAVSAQYRPPFHRTLPPRFHSRAPSSS